MAAKTRVVILMDAPEIKRLDAIAADRRVSRGEVAREALRWWADYHDPHGAPPHRVDPPAWSGAVQLPSTLPDPLPPSFT